MRSERFNDTPLCSTFSEVIKACESREVDPVDVAHLATMLYVYLISGLPENTRAEMFSAIAEDIKSAMELYPKFLSGDLTNLTLQ